MCTDYVGGSFEVLLFLTVLVSIYFKVTSWAMYVKYYSKHFYSARQSIEISTTHEPLCRNGRCEAENTWR
jgi:hypothetical protein